MRKRTKLDATVAEAVVDAHTDDEQVSVYTMIADHLAMPFRTAVLGADHRDRAGADTPVLIVHGADDIRPTWALDSLHDALPRSKRLTLAGIGHVPWIEAAAEFRRQPPNSCTTTRP